MIQIPKLIKNKPVHTPRKPKAKPDECTLSDLPAVAADLLGWRAVTNGLQPMHYVDATGAFVFYIGDWQPHQDLNQAAIIRQQCFDYSQGEDFAARLAGACDAGLSLQHDGKRAFTLVAAEALNATADKITLAACGCLFALKVWETQQT